MLKILFALSAVSYIVFLFIYRFFVTKIKDNVKISNFLAFVSVFLIIYIIVGFILTITTSGIINKLAVLFFALCPFIIGRLATYEKEKIYTLLQLAIMLISAIFILTC